jgi:hypothetical protein
MSLTITLLPDLWINHVRPFLLPSKSNILMYHTIMIHELKERWEDVRYDQSDVLDLLDECAIHPFQVHQLRKNGTDVFFCIHSWNKYSQCLAMCIMHLDLNGKVVCNTFYYRDVNQWRELVDSHDASWTCCHGMLLCKREIKWREWKKTRMIIRAQRAQRRALILSQSQSIQAGL